METQAHSSDNIAEASDRVDEDENMINVNTPLMDVPSLSFGQTLGYSIGHVLNDLCSGIWFSYLLIYMEL